MKPEPIKAYVVDDEKSAVLRLVDLLGKQSGVETVGWSIGIKEAIKGILKSKPDLLFLDIEMADGTGFDVLKSVRDQGHFPKVIFVTAYTHYAIEAIRREALDYILKPVHETELIDAINRVKAKRQGISLNQLPSCLSDREKEVLNLILQGKKSKEIAEELNLSKLTVDTHRRNILEKLGGKNFSKFLTNFY